MAYVSGQSQNATDAGSSEFFIPFQDALFVLPFLHAPFDV